jgi:hypothetical protein
LRLVQEADLPDVVKEAGIEEVPQRGRRKSRLGSELDASHGDPEGMLLFLIQGEVQNQGEGFEQILEKAMFAVREDSGKQVHGVPLSSSAD